MLKLNIKIYHEAIDEKSRKRQQQKKIQTMNTFLGTITVEHER